MDVTGFLRQFLVLDQSSLYYEPSYYLSYRRKFKPGNIRFAVGGSLDSRDINSPDPEDLNEYFSNSRSLDTRIGWEFISVLSPKWEVFYGLDFRTGFLYSKNDAVYWNNGYANGVETNTSNYGIAPVLGVRFKLTERISLLTEASFALIQSNEKTRRYYTPVNSTYSPMADINSDTQRLYTSFAQPVAVYFTFDL